MRALILLLLVGAILVPTVAHAGKADPLLDLAEFHMRHHDYASALPYFEKAVVAEPTNMHALMGLQEASLLAGKDVLGVYEAKFTENPEDPSAVCLLARIVPPEKALALLKKVVGPGFFVHICRARALLMMGEDPDAELRLADTLCPDDVRAIGLLAGYFEEAGNLFKAKELFTTAMEKDPKRLEAVVGLGNVLRLDEDIDEAVKLLQQAELLDKEDPEVHYRFGLCHFDRGDWDMAIRSFKASLAIVPGEVDVLLGLGESYMRKDDKLEEAEVQFKRAVELAPRRVDARRRLGFALDLQEKNDEALEQYEELLKIDPLNASCRVAIGWVLLKKGKNEKAMGEFRQAADMDASDPTAMFFIGYSHDVLGRWGEAAEAYEKLIRKFPEYARGYNNLGLDQDLLGKSTKAVRNFKKAVDLDPDNTEYLLNLGDAYYNAKKYKEAVNVLSDLVDLDPEFAPGWTALGRSQRAIRKYKESAQSYERGIEFTEEGDEVADLHLIVGIIYQENLKKYQQALEHYQEYLKLGGQDPVVEAWIEECNKKLK